MTGLCPPLAVVEKGDDEFMFFSSVDDVLNDRFDILWDEAYDGWDATGQYFSLVRREAKRRWWQKLSRPDCSFLEIDYVQPSFRLPAAEERIRRLLHSKAPSFAELIAVGAGHHLFGANTVTKERANRRR